MVDDIPLRRQEYCHSLAEALSVTPPVLPPTQAGSGTDPHRNYETRSQRVLNRQLKEATGWVPRYASVVEGWPAMLAQVEGTR